MPILTSAPPTFAETNPVIFAELIYFSPRLPQPIRLREHINRFPENRMKWDLSEDRATPSSQPLSVPRVYRISSSQPIFHHSSA